MSKKEFEIELKPMSNSEKQRIEEAYERLLCCNPTGVRLKPDQEWTPAWSSYGLEQLIEKVLSAPEGRISDLFLGFWKALEVTNAPLTQWMANFIEYIVRYSLMHYNKRNKKGFTLWPFDREELEWMVPLVNKGCTEAQACLAVRVLPVSLTVSCKETILKILEKTNIMEYARSTTLLDFARGKLSRCFNMAVPLEQRLEEIFEDVKLRHNRGGLIDWNDLSSIYHAITYCNNSGTLKNTWLKRILSLNFTPKLIKEAAKEATGNFEYIERSISEKSYLNEDNWGLVLMYRLELEIIKDFFHYKKVNFPPLELASLCEKLKELSQNKENKDAFDLSVSQLKKDSPLPFSDVWFQANIGKEIN